MRRALVTLLLGVGLLLAGCSSYVNSSTLVDANEFNGIVQTAGTQTVDVRTPAEFTAGHLQGAINIDVESTTFTEQISALDMSGTYAVYCQSGNRSQTATKQMADAGLNSIYELDGGISAWTAAGLPVTQ